MKIVPVVKTIPLTEPSKYGYNWIHVSLKNNKNHTGKSLKCELWSTPIKKREKR